MKVKLTKALVWLVIVCPSSRLVARGQNGAAPRCDAPECDPFVPGTIISLSPEGHIKVNSTWPRGPADEAGICPGDEILSANGIQGSDTNFDNFLQAIMSDKPTPVDLKIKRGSQDFDFRVQRVRESMPAELSEQKYARLPVFPDMERLVTVPLDESSEELQAFSKFELQLAQHYGFRLAERYWVPEGTPQEQFAQIARFLRSGSDRMVATLYPNDARGPDCSFLLLKNPGQLLVGLVEPDSTTARAGLFPGDEVVEVDGQLVRGLDQKQLGSLIFKADNHPHEVSLCVHRGTSDVLVKIETEHQKDLGYGFTVFGGRMRPQKPLPYLLGLQVAAADQPRRIMVRAEAYPSPAFRAGFLPGDLLTAVNGEPIEKLQGDRLSELLNPASPSEVTLDIDRLGRHLRLRVVPATQAQAQAEIGRKITANGPASAQCTEPAKPVN